MSRGDSSEQKDKDNVNDRNNEYDEDDGHDAHIYNK